MQAIRPPGLEVVDLVGHTTLPQYLYLLQHLAKAVVGLNSGGIIFAAGQGTPTVGLWATGDYGCPVHFPRCWAWSWLRGDEPYEVCYYGDPETGTPQGALDALGRVVGGGLAAVTAEG